MSDYAIEFNNVWKKFRKGERFDSLRDLIPAMTKRIFSPNGSRPELEKNEFWALKDVSFKVKKGEVLGIIGPNGAGKSTILKAISRIIKPDKGEIITRGRVSALIEVGAGFHPDLTGRENIYLNGAILGMTRKEIDEKFDQIVDFAGLREFVDTPIKRYSSGMQARLGFAVAAHMDPDILLVDEVLSVGDAVFRAKCLNKMKSLIEGNVTVVFVSHNMELIRTLTEKCLLLDAGEVLFYGNTEEAIKQYMQVVQRGRTNLNVDEKLYTQYGKILGLSIFDKGGKNTNQINCFDPVMMVVDFEIYKEIPSIAIGISFSLPYGGWPANCNTIRDNIYFKPKIGRNKIGLKIDSFNLSPGDYDITVRLMVPEWNIAIDYHHCRYKILVLGEPHPGHVVQLKHEWVTIYE